MNSPDPGFIFFNDCAGAPDGWGITLRALRQAEPLSLAELTNVLVRFASEYGLHGNVWQQWLAYVLMMHENPFTLACERRDVIPESTLVSMAAADMSVFYELMNSCPVTEFTSYSCTYAGEHATEAGRVIARLAEELSGSEDAERFSATVIEHYRTHGIGIFGLYKAFRITELSGIRDIDIVPVEEAADVRLEDLVGYEEQKARLRENTEAFITGNAANNVLLYGDSGTGKSTSVHALMHDYHSRGLRLIELSKHERRYLPAVLSLIKKRNYKFILFLDDLSFEENESDYKELKAMLEGALETRSDKVLIYATSNRRHLIRETWRDRSDMEYQEDIHHSDTMEEKLSLASRFGVTIYYSKPAPAEYLNIVRELAAREDIDIDDTELTDLARKWELRYGGMTGRTASQFIIWLRGKENRD